MTAIPVSELKQRAKLPAVQAGGQVVSQFFDANKAAISAVLPRHVSPDRLMKIALGAMRTTPKLMEATVDSLFAAVVQCAQLGLEPNTPLGHVYLIPFANKRAGRTDVQVILGYKGLLDLARRSGQIISIAAHAVHAGDAFEFAYGLSERLEHVPARGERGEITHFYAVAKLTGGGHAFEVMSREEVDTIRNASQGFRSAKQYGKADHPWIANYSEMGRKTAIRRLFKYLPVSIEIARAVRVDEMAESGSVANFDDVISGEWSVDREPSTEAPEKPTTATNGDGDTNASPPQDYAAWAAESGEVSQ